MNRFARAISRTVAAALFVAAACASAPSGGAPPSPDAIHLVVLHSNDMHGAIQSANAAWLDAANPPQVGGMPCLVAAIRKLREEARAEGAEVLVLDAGDIFQGTPEGNLTGGKLVVDLMNLAGYDVWAIGNHEYDFGEDLAREVVSRSAVPVLGANVLREDTGARVDYLEPSVVLVRAGIRIGIGGILTQDMKQVVLAENVEGLSFGPELDTARALLADLEPKTDIRLLLTHVGLPGEQAIAAQVPGIDLIVGGHTHEPLAEGWTSPETGTLVVHTGAKARWLGRVDLWIGRQTKQVLRKTSRLIELDSRVFGQDPEALELVNRYAPEIAKVMDVTIGEMQASAWRAPGYASSMLGNWITNIMARATKADIAFHNKTGIRSDLPKGKVTYRRVYEVAPFGNTLVTTTLTGEQVKAVLEGMLEREGKMLEVSGLSVEADLALPFGSRVTKVTVGKKKLDPAKKYRVVTNNFIAAGGDGHRVFTEGEATVDTGILLRDALAEHIKRRTPVWLRYKNRLLVKTPGAAAPTAAPVLPAVQVQESK